MGSSQLYLIAKIISNAQAKGDTVLAEQLTWYYKKYQKVHIREKHLIFTEFIEFCKEEQINLNEELITEKQVA